MRMAEIILRCICPEGQAVVACDVSASPLSQRRSDSHVPAQLLVRGGVQSRSRKRAARTDDAERAGRAVPPGGWTSGGAGGPLRAPAHAAVEGSSRKRRARLLLP